MYDCMQKRAGEAIPYDRIQAYSVTYDDILLIGFEISPIHSLNMAHVGMNCINHEQFVITPRQLSPSQPCSTTLPLIHRGLTKVISTFSGNTLSPLTEVPSKLTHCDRRSNLAI